MCTKRNKREDILCGSYDGRYIMFRIARIKVGIHRTIQTTLPFDRGTNSEWGETSSPVWNWDFPRVNVLGFSKNWKVSYLVNFSS